MNRILLSIIILTLLTIGCGESSSPNAGIYCGEGTNITVDGQLLCVYRQSVVVEDGFQCPAEFSHLEEDAGLGICSASPLEESSIDDVREKFRKTDPQYEGCTKSAHCQEEKMCSVGRCQTPPKECTLDSDCGKDEKCSALVCSPKGK